MKCCVLSVYIDIKIEDNCRSASVSDVEINIIIILIGVHSMYNYVLFS